MEQFKAHFKLLLDRIEAVSNESEENRKNSVSDFLKSAHFAPAYEINTNSFKDGFNPFIEQKNEITSKLDSKFKKLNDFVIIYRGLETKDNSKWLSTAKLDENHKPILLGRDVNKYETEFSANYINFIKSEMKSNANEDFYKKTKILMRRTGSYIIADIEKEGLFALKNLYLIIPKNEGYINQILAQLNSKLFDYYHKSKTSGENKAFAQFTGEYISNFPCTIDLSKEENFENIINEIKDSKKATPSVSTAEKEGEIDRLVYGLYGLTAEEIGIVEGSIK
jgi:TaqI-like C-terminal specificity domain